MLAAMPLSLSPRGRVLLAFASVYIFWGSTYTAIHIADEQLPPPVISAARSLLTTLVLLAVLRWTGKSLRVPRGEGPKLVLVGLLFMSANNLLLTWGETMVPSGFASLVVSTMPIMIALMEMALPGGELLNKRGWAGTALGCAGIGVLVWPSLHAHAAGALDSYTSSRSALGVLVLLFAALAFGVGSVLSRRFRFQAETLVATCWQIGAAAIFNTLFVLASGSLKHAVWTWRGSAAVAYLAVFGSVFGLVALTYLLQHVAVTKVATYAFVNPLVAVLLGSLLLGEHLTRTELFGMGVIVCAVALVIFSRVAGRSGGTPARTVAGRMGDAVR